jgi:SAM-dependent methyltransferase
VTLLSGSIPGADGGLVPALDLYADGLADRQPVVLRWRDGSASPLAARQWRGAPSRGDETVLARCSGATLDVGCGPGRMTLALTERGLPALGIDVSLPALSLARRAGAPVLLRSVFDDVPDAGSWAHVLLVDGNVGIGGDPVTLLRRASALLAPGGDVLVELDPPGAPTGGGQVRLEAGGQRSPWFSWGRVGTDSVGAAATAAGLAVAGTWACDGRHFATLTRA